MIVSMTRRQKLVVFSVWEGSLAGSFTMVDKIIYNLIAKFQSGNYKQLKLISINNILPF